MIKFFRKIRQNLISEGKTARYLKYAFGEIVLVVIGILIALQINNWNEKRKDDKIETKILLEIKNNLETDLEDLEGNNNSYARRTKSHEYIINWLESNEILNDSLQMSLFITSFSTDIFINRSAYENLKQNGLRSISNDSLRNQISHLYEYQYKKHIYYNDQLTEIVNIVRSDYARYFNGLGWPSEKILVNNLNDLKNDFSFIYHQKSARAIAGVLSKLTTPQVKKEVSKTIEMIDAELKSRPYE